MTKHRYTNALVNETSPYLLQHAHNPVDWYPWGEGALSRAKREDRPILLSIGYSACHWCHVMEHESFENEQIAKLMNDNFINIKVDREERPDLDAIYMAAVQMMTGSGGWPLTVFLTPDQIPFFGGTYFPPESRYGRPGFLDLLLAVVKAYRENRSAIYSDTEKFLASMQRLSSLPNIRGELKVEVLDAALANLISDYDPKYGGFGKAPKFPPSMALSFIMRSYQHSGENRLLEICENTLEKMACGGLYDQLGGGFHRYSVDDRWLVPHFEKMLYDNALLSRAYLDAYLLTKKDLYKRISRETLDYVIREMTSPEGGFYSSQDADSEGKEGAYFLWSPHEVDVILGSEEARIFCSYFGITDEGNFEGKNILHAPQPADVVAGSCKITEESLSEIIRSGRQLLLRERKKRIKPARDEKILTAWNGLMLRSFAEAAAALDNRDYLQAAIRNADFLLAKMRSNGQLLRSYKDEHARFNAYLEDYACLIDGLLALYEATFDPRRIEQAEELAKQMVAKFWDSRGVGFYFTSDDHESLIQRPKEYNDNATPSGNSVSAHALLRLWKFTGSEKWSSYSISILESMADLMEKYPSGFPHLLCALDFYLGAPKEIAIIGNPQETQTRELLNEVFHIYLPNKVVACGLDSDIFLLKGKTQKGNLATAYVCENFVCELPATTTKDLRAHLSERD